MHVFVLSSLLHIHVALIWIGTALRIITLNTFSVSMRFLSGSAKLKLLRYITIFSILKNVEHSLNRVRRRVTRRLTRLQTMCNNLKYRTKMKYDEFSIYRNRGGTVPEPERNSSGTGNFFNLIMRSTVLIYIYLQ